LVSINPFAGSAQQILVGGVAGGVGTLIQVLEPGTPINSFFVYEHKRNADGSPVWADTNGDGTINEQDLYVDQDGDGVVNVADRRAFEDPAPKWIIGHTSNMTYGAFDLNFTLRAYMGNYVYNNVASNLGTYAEVTRASPYNLHASVLETGFETPQYLSDYYVEDASFLRMDNITLGYSFEYRGRPARIFGTIQSAFTLTGYSGVDPTAGLNGLDNNLYPRSRTFTGGLNFRF
jgi:iron complex outermembrane receptor protein